MMEGRKFCDQCGKEIPAQAQFCPFCGARIPEMPVVEEKVSERTEAVASEIKGMPSPKEKKKRLSPVVAVLIAGGLLLAIVLSVVFVSKKGDDLGKKSVSLVGEWELTDYNSDINWTLERLVGSRIKFDKDEMISQGTASKYELLEGGEIKVTNIVDTRYEYGFLDNNTLCLSTYGTNEVTVYKRILGGEDDSDALIADDLVFWISTDRITEDQKKDILAAASELTKYGKIGVLCSGEAGNLSAIYEGFIAKYFKDEADVFVFTVDWGSGRICYGWNGSFKALEEEKYREIMKQSGEETNSRAAYVEEILMLVCDEMQAAGRASTA